MPIRPAGDEWLSFGRSLVLPVAVGDPLKETRNGHSCAKNASAWRSDRLRCLTTLRMHNTGAEYARRFE